MNRWLNTQQTGFTLLEALVHCHHQHRTGRPADRQFAKHPPGASKLITGLDCCQGMASRMRVNKMGVHSGDYDCLSTNKKVMSKRCGGTYSLPKPNYCQTISCNAQQVAYYDLIQWKQALNASLPNPRGSIKHIKSSRNPKPYPFRITISWHPPKSYQNKVRINHPNEATRCQNAAKHCLTRRVTL